MHRHPRDTLTCTLQNLGNVACLALAGEVNLDNALVLKAHLQMASKARENTIIVDLTDLRQLDSSGVDVLLEGQRKLAGRGQMIVLVAPSFSIRKVLGVLRLEEAMPIFVSVEEALTYLRAASDFEERPLASS